MRELHAYARLGAVLIPGGIIGAIFFYAVARSTALTALGLSSVLLGVVALFLARSLPQIPPQAARLLLQAGLDNLAGLLEELGLRAPALYLPSRLFPGRPGAFIPLSPDSRPPSGQQTLPQRLVVDTGPGPADVGILVSTPGTTVMPLLQDRPGTSSSDLEAALARVLVGGLDVARGVLVSQEDGRVTVRVEDVRFEWDDLWVYEVIGSPVASVVAALVAEGKGQPVTIRDEERIGSSLVVHLQVVP